MDIQIRSLPRGDRTYSVLLNRMRRLNCGAGRYARGLKRHQDTMRYQGPQLPPQGRSEESTTDSISFFYLSLSVPFALLRHSAKTSDTHLRTPHPRWDFFFSLLGYPKTTILPLASRCPLSGGSQSSESPWETESPYTCTRRFGFPL